MSNEAELRAHAAHRWFLAFLAAGLLSMIALVELTFFRFPTSIISSGIGPKANIPIWFGPANARFVYLGLGLLYAAAYVWVAWWAPSSGRAWVLGARYGLAPSVIVLRPLSLLATLVLPIVAGARRAGDTGRARDGALTGFWCGLVVAVALAVTSLALDHLLASVLMNTWWAHDPTCPQPAGPGLAGCEIGDNLGLIALELTMVPLLLMAAGALGGVIGVSRTPSKDVRPNQPTGSRPVIIFCSLMLALFLLEITFKLV